MNTHRAALTFLVALSGCTARTGAPAGTKITVQEFVIPRDVVVQRYGGAYQGLGMKYAEVLARQLKGLGYDTTVVPQGAPLAGDLNVTGRIAEIDGGSTAKRVLLGFGAGRSEFDVIGTVTRADGSTLGEFTESRAGKGWGEESAVEGAMIRTAKLIGRMIYTGQYRRNAPADRPAAKAFEEAQHAPEAASTVQERLQALEQLRKAGTITPAEYESKRQAIIDSL